MKPLRRITFDGYILACMLRYQKKHGNNVGFKLMEVPNRNPKIVSDELWKKILYQHLRHFNQN